LERFVLPVFCARDGYRNNLEIQRSLRGYSTGNLTLIETFEAEEYAMIEFKCLKVYRLLNQYAIRGFAPAILISLSAISCKERNSQGLDSESNLRDTYSGDVSDITDPEISINYEANIDGSPLKDNTLINEEAYNKFVQNLKNVFKDPNFAGKVFFPSKCKFDPGYDNFYDPPESFYWPTGYAQGKSPLARYYSYGERNDTVRLRAYSTAWSTDCLVARGKRSSYEIDKSKYTCRQESNYIALAELDESKQFGDVILFNSFKNPTDLNPHSYIVLGMSYGGRMIPIQGIAQTNLYRFKRYASKAHAHQIIKISQKGNSNSVYTCVE
jgi:hypothetical protein